MTGGEGILVSFPQKSREENFSLLIAARSSFSRLARRLKQKEWANFCEEANSSQKMARLNKFFQGNENKTLGLVKDSNNEYYATPEASINLLMDTHFPGSLSYMVKPHATAIRMEIEDQEVEFISPTRVRKAIWSFGDLKAAGPDKIKPIVLKHLGDKAVNKLVEFFKASSLLGYVPLQWRDSKPVFIPKPGKSEYSLANSFRPISLSSFIMKALEKVWATGRGNSNTKTPSVETSAQFVEDIVRTLLFLPWWNTLNQQ